MHKPGCAKPDSISTHPAKGLPCQALRAHSTWDVGQCRDHEDQGTPKPDFPLWKTFWALGSVTSKHLGAAKSHWHLREALGGTNPAPEVSPFAIKTAKRRAEVLGFTWPGKSPPLPPPVWILSDPAFTCRGRGFSVTHSSRSSLG